MFTQSKAKSQNELLGKRALGSNSRNVKSTRKLTRAWHILDVSGYYMANKNIMLRLGYIIYSTIAMLLGKRCVKQHKVRSINIKMLVAILATQHQDETIP